MIIETQDILSETNEEPISQMNTATEHFLSTENFQRLRELQIRLFKTIDVSPSMRKLVNLLITEQNVHALYEQLTRQ